MKNKIFLVSGAVLLASAVLLAVYVNNGKSAMPEFFNANVEALAQNENKLPQGHVICYHSVYDDGLPGYYLRVRECMNCTEVDATVVSNQDNCLKP